MRPLSTDTQTLSPALGAEVIYKAIHEDEAFASLPAAIARAVGARSAMILWRHSDGVCEALAWSHHDRPYVELYAAKYAAIDPWMIAAFGERGFSEIIRMEDHTPLSAFEQSRFSREFLIPHGDDTRHRAGMVIRTPWGEGVVGVERGRDAPAFEAAELSPLSESFPHLRRLLLARGEQAADRRGPKLARDDLDDLIMGSVVTGGDGHVVQVNFAADRVLRRADGLLTAANRLTCVDRRSGAALDAAIEAATRPDGGATLVQVERGAGRLAYLVSVLPAPGPFGRGRARLVFRDPEAAEPAITDRLGGLRGPAREAAGGRAMAAARRAPARSPGRGRGGSGGFLDNLGALAAGLWRGAEAPER